MKAMWKYPLPALETEYLFVGPKDFVPLHLAVQQGVPTIWAQVDPDAEMVSQRFIMVGTGHREIPDDALYVGTFMTHDQSFVWHVYWTPSKEPSL